MHHPSTSIGMPAKQRGQVLIVIFLGALLFGGAAGGAVLVFGGRTAHQIHKQIKALEPDKSKRIAIDHTLDLIENEAKRLQSERSELEHDTFATLKRHESTPEQFRALQERADVINSMSTKRLLDLRFELRDQLSDAQWREIFSSPPQQSEGAKR
jgi:hypothetical protein